ncbi:hypothetical protein QVD99_005568 [Batrachochytrium dendrobatidis]|nr:hypothetical protein QVD99_005568 [Batrachochytrium dendrobatidis]
MDSSKQSNTQDDVKRFLEDLDSITGPPKPNSSSTALNTVKPPVSTSKDILSFLDEIDAPPIQVTSAPEINTFAKPAAVDLAPIVTTAAKPSLPQVSKPIARPPPKTTALLNTASIPVGTLSTGAPADIPTLPSDIPSGSSAQSKPQEQPLPSTDQSLQQQLPNNWSWGTIWSSAASATVKGLESMQTIAEHTAQTISSNDKVRGIYAGMAPEINRLGADLSSFAKISATTIADTIAPPIHRFGSHGASFAPTINVWFCADISDVQVLEQLHNFVQSTLDEMWIKPFMPADSKTGVPLSADINPRIVQVCDRVAVNSIHNPEPVMAKNVNEAIVHSETMISRLQTLSQAKKDEAVENRGQNAMAGKADQSAPDRECFLVIQPYSTILPSSQLFDATKHIQYFTTMVCDAGDLGMIAPLTISQSVAIRNPSTQSEAHWAAWEQTLHRRVIETVIADLCEEFVVAVRF